MHLLSIARVRVWILGSSALACAGCSLLFAESNYRNEKSDAGPADAASTDAGVNADATEISDAGGDAASPIDGDVTPATTPGWPTCGDGVREHRAGSEESPWTVTNPLRASLFGTSNGGREAGSLLPSIEFGSHPTTDPFLDVAIMAGNDPNDVFVAAISARQMLVARFDRAMGTLSQPIVRDGDEGAYLALSGRNLEGNPEFGVATRREGAYYGLGYTILPDRSLVYGGMEVFFGQAIESIEGAATYGFGSWAVLALTSEGSLRVHSRSEEFTFPETIAGGVRSLNGYFTLFRSAQGLPFLVLFGEDDGARLARIGTFDAPTSVVVEEDGTTLHMVQVDGASSPFSLRSRPLRCENGACVCPTANGGDCASPSGYFAQPGSMQQPVSVEVMRTSSGVLLSTVLEETRPSGGGTRIALYARGVDGSALPVAEEGVAELDSGQGTAFVGTGTSMRSVLVEDENSIDVLNATIVRLTGGTESSSHIYLSGLRICRND